MTIKELKTRKVIPAIRRNNSFISNAEKQEAFERAIAADGWSIKVAHRSGAGINYTLEKRENEKHRWFCRPEDEKNIRRVALNYLNVRHLPISREYRDGEYIVFETEISRAEKWLPFNRPEMNFPEHRGELVFRSKDYYFQFKNEKGTTYYLYGVDLKKDMLHGNVIHYENEFGVSIDYIMEL